MQRIGSKLRPILLGGLLVTLPLAAAGAKNVKPDPNGLPHNPLWTWQTRQQNQGKIPDTPMCHDFSQRGSTLGFPDANMSPVFRRLHRPDRSLRSRHTHRHQCDDLQFGAIPYFGDTLAGYGNWFPITVEGSGGWGDHGADDDYTFTTEPTAKPIHSA